ncbi:MAG: helix-turn-helix transcriptional regulator [Frankia sp.]|nr:helix-turn-helix transcriptional regulator [Frankia sp.]
MHVDAGMAAASGGTGARDRGGNPPAGAGQPAGAGTPAAGATSPTAGEPAESRAGQPGRVPNSRLRLCREEKGWSQERLAVELRRFAVMHEGREAGVTGNMICKWEKGDKKPSLRYQRLLRALFARSSSELGFTDDGPSPAAPGTVVRNDVLDLDAATGAPLLLAQPAGLPPAAIERRGFLRMMAAGGIAVVPVGVAAPTAGDQAPWDRLSAALRGRATVTPELATELSQFTAGLYGLEERVPAKTLMPRVSGHLGTLTQLLESTSRSPVRRQLASTAGETAALAGWLAFDMGDTTTALSYYRVAIEAAREADDNELWACVLGYESYQPGAAGRPDQACALLTEAQRRAGPAASGLTAAWLAGREAEEQATRGDSRAALTALDRARDAFDRAGREERVWTGFFDRGRLDGLRVTTYLRLRRPAAASLAASDALRAAGPAATKKRSLLLGDVAEVYVQRRDIDAACQLAADALAIVAQTDFSLGLARVQRVRERLSPWQSSQPVRDLDEQLRALV